MSGKYSFDLKSEERRRALPGKIMFDEMCGLLGPRNALTWFTGEMDPPHMQFEFNGLWFDHPFTVLRFWTETNKS